MLHTEDYLRDILPGSFIFYQPKDIVSGDFYWIGKSENKIIIIAADCTGHGVPGAFMSMLGVAFLDDIVNRQKTIAPDSILNKLREKIMKALNQTGKKSEAKDGMDVAAIVIDPEKQVLQYAGAYNPLYIIQNNDMVQIKGDKMPIAIHHIMKPFTLHERKIYMQDTIYIFSDGFPDQFGGELGRKFMYKRFREHLYNLKELSMDEQKENLYQTFLQWKGDYEQVDDILVIGLRFLS
jgi:serine phosphatase RsbU (regulator of sigma subunit)